MFMKVIFYVSFMLFSYLKFKLLEMLFQFIYLVGMQLMYSDFNTNFNILKYRTQLVKGGQYLS